MEAGPTAMVWYDIDLETLDEYEVWKPESLDWARTVDCAKVNELFRSSIADFPADDLDLAFSSADAAEGLNEADRCGLFSLYAEPIFVTSFQISGGGHRITAMRSQGIRWALGQCLREDVGVSVDERHAYVR